MGIYSSAIAARLRPMMQQNVALIVSDGAITTQSAQLQAVSVVS